MKYTEIIKNSKFYIPMNLNLGYLLEDTEIMLLMTIIHCSELDIKVSIPRLEKFTARSQSTIKRKLKVLKGLRLVSEDNKPCLEQIEIVYNAVNNAKTVKDRKAWCDAYKKNKGQIEPMKEGQNEPTKKGQIEPPYNEYIDNEYINKEDLFKLNTNIKLNNNILKEERKNKELEEALKEVEEGNQNESKSKIERNDDSMQYQGIQNKSLSPRGNKEITKTLEGLWFYKDSISTNTFNDCCRLLHEVATSSKDNYKVNLTKARKGFNTLFEGFKLEQRKPFSQALVSLSKTLGEAFK